MTVQAWHQKPGLALRRVRAHNDHGAMGGMCLALRTDNPRPYFPDVIDVLTILFQPENVHQRAALLQ